MHAKQSFHVVSRSHTLLSLSSVYIAAYSHSIPPYSPHEVTELTMMMTTTTPESNHFAIIKKNSSLLTESDRLKI